MTRAHFLLLPAFFFTTAVIGAPARESDPLLVGSKWTGKLVQRGTFPGGASGPPRFDIVLVVTQRQGAKFEGELQEQTRDLKITYLVKGEIAAAPDGKSYALQFESHDSKNVENTTPLLGIPYAATLSGKTLKGTWKLKRPQDEIDIEGDFALDLAK